MTTEPLFKVVVCGRAGVGKTSLLHATDPRWRLDTATPTAPTIAVDFFSLSVPTSCRRSVRLQFWDTAGQERFASPVTATFRNADAIIFVYDITNRDSFEAMARILGDALAARGSGEPHVIIIGSKLDLAPTQRAVAVAEAEEGCRARGYTLLETSALERTNVDIMLQTLADALVLRVTPPPRNTDQLRLMDQHPRRLSGKPIAPTPPPPGSCAC